MYQAMKLASLITFMSLTLVTSAIASPVVTIKMKSISYDPKQIEVEAGQKVIWENVAYTDHSATSNDNGTTFDTGMIAPHQSSKEVRFEHPGTFPYHCKTHGMTMSGVVIVKAAQK
jgi:plastocyanin